MIDEKELALWIARLETEESSWQNYERLATLYTVRDHQENRQEYTAHERSVPLIMYSSAGAPSENNDSEFLRAVTSGDMNNALDVMDELMETLKVINRRVYDNVLQRLKRA